MPRTALLFLALAYSLMTTGWMMKAGGGLDPLGLTSNPPAPPLDDQGSGLDPLG